MINRRQIFLATFLGLAILLALPSGLSAVTSADSPNAKVSLSEYEKELDRFAAAVSELPDHPEKIGPLRQSLPSSWIVEVGGQEYDISSGWINGALAEIEKQSKDRNSICDAAVNRLHALRAEAEAMATAAARPDVADGKVRLLRILSAREFRHVEQQSWLSQLWDQVQRWIDWVLQHTLGRLLGQGALRTTILYTMIAVVFLFVAVWIVRSLRTLVRTETLRVDAVFPPGKTWRDWAREALSAAGIADYRGALHASYWAGVYRLAELGAWKLDRARTPREYLQLVKQQPDGDTASRNESAASQPGRAAALAALTRSMESSWYGYVPATEQDFDVAVNHLETLGCRLRSTAQTASS